MFLDMIKDVRLRYTMEWMTDFPLRFFYNFNVMLDVLILADRAEDRRQCANPITLIQCIGITFMKLQKTSPYIPIAIRTMQKFLMFTGISKLPSYRNVYHRIHARHNTLWQMPLQYQNPQSIRRMIWYTQAIKSFFPEYWNAPQQSESGVTMCGYIWLRLRGKLPNAVQPPSILNKGVLMTPLSHEDQIWVDSNFHTANTQALKYGRQSFSNYLAQASILMAATTGMFGQIRNRWVHLCIKLGWIHPITSTPTCDNRLVKRTPTCCRDMTTRIRTGRWSRVWDMATPVQRARLATLFHVFRRLAGAGLPMELWHIILGYDMQQHVTDLKYYSACIIIP